MSSQTQSLDQDLSKLKLDRSKKRPREGHGVMLILAAIVIGGGAAGGYFMYSKANAAIVVKVVTPVRDTGSVASSAVLTAGGYVVARDFYELSSKIAGRVKKAYVDRGDYVEEGDLILELEDDEYVAQVQQSEARVASAKARLAQMKAGSRPQEIGSARAAVTAAKATAAKARAVLGRQEQLAREGIVSSQELDLARADSGVAAANVETATENLGLVEAGPRQEEIDVAAAQVQEAEANLAYAKTQLAFTVIRAPVSGTLLYEMAKKGELVTSSTFGGSRGSVANLTDLQVEIDVNEDDFPKVHMGQPCDIRVDSHPKVVIRGELDEIAPSADRQKATIQVKVRIIDPPDFVRPGISVRVTFIEEGQEEEATVVEETLWIPRKAVKTGADGPIVYIAFRGRAKERSVKLGGEGPLGVQVREGLVGTESLITDPLSEITDGTPVDPLP